MSKYTLELFRMLQDKNFELFDFDYDFYCDNEGIKRNFESKFKQQYLFYEIGTETVQRFKIMLQTKLNIIMPYYKQIYETELRVEEIDFMLNKDYTETQIREIRSTNKNNVTSQNTVENTTSNNSIDNIKESNINNGISNVSLKKGVTGMSETKNKFDSSDNSVNNSNQNSLNENIEKEIFTNVGKGNIGVTSSAELLKNWRETILNIDKMIIDECYDLFMLVY